MLLPVLTTLEMTDSAGAFPLGEVGEPPQLSRNEVAATSVSACEQNSRRLDLGFSMSAAWCNGYAAQKPKEFYRSSCRDDGILRKPLQSVAVTYRLVHHLAVSAIFALVVIGANAQTPAPVAVNVFPAVIHPGDVLRIEVPRAKA